jgi:hypothetical protein
MIAQKLPVFCQKNRAVSLFCCILSKKQGCGSVGMFFGFLDPDPLVIGTGIDPDPDPSIIKQK